MTTDEFNRKTESGKLILVDFSAIWCGPCQMMIPIIKKIKEKFKNDKNVEILTVDIDANPVIPAKFSIMSIPSFVYIKNGKVLDTVIDATTKDNLIKKIEKYKEEK